MRQAFPTTLAKAVTLLCAALGVASPARAYSYPTRWVIENRTSDPVVLTCEGDSGSAGVEIKDLYFLRVPARGQTVFTWPGYYANDGLGLNAARWACQDQASGDVLESFSTDWGEDIRLVLTRKGNRVSLLKN
jgi:hypothetical protein